MGYGSFYDREDGEYNGFDFMEIPNIFVMQNDFFDNKWLYLTGLSMGLEVSVALGPVGRDV